jgi:phospholipase C
MDGFVAEAEKGRRGCGGPNDPSCSPSSMPDVMGYHDAREIPNYWAWANHFVLQDHMFEPNASWSLPQHLFMVSEWSARCMTPDPMSCRNAVQSPAFPPDFAAANGQAQPPPDYAWTDLTWLLHREKVSWRYYVQSGTEPDCRNNAVDCAPVNQNARTPGIWNPLPFFRTVQLDGELTNVTDVSNYYRDARTGQLPAVSWITPSNANSEHPTAKVSEGQAWVTSLVNAAMSGPEWSSTAVFISWDDWGGFYDHVVPPVVDENGYGLRVPGLVISPYAKAGYLDHQVLSHDAYVKLVEDLFLGGARIDPKTDGRPDTRPDVRENASQLGNLLADFNFSQAPQPPMLLPVHPPPGPASAP